MDELDWIWLVVILGGILISGLIKLFFLARRNKNEINFDEFDDTNKIKQREKQEKEDIIHEANVMSKVYREAYSQKTEEGSLLGHLAGIEAMEKAKEDLANFKIMDAVEVDEEGINEGTPIHNLKENGNNIEIALFKTWARGIFGCIKIGSEEQLNVVKTFVEPELFNKLLLQAKAFEKDGLEFVTEDLMINKCNIYDYGRSLETEELKVLIDANMKEYIMKKSDRSILRGNKHKFNNKKVLMTFVKKKSEEQEGIIQNCPNCGTALSQVELGKCRYCGTIILPIRYNWTLTKFETI